MPEKLPVSETRKVLIPTTSPRALTSGPPELPGLMAASVWMNSPGARRSPANGLGRFSALTIPRVTVKRNPIGLPNASTVWPGCSFVESPSGTLVRLVASTLITARSVRRSAPMSFAGRIRRSVIVT